MKSFDDPNDRSNNSQKSDSNKRHKYSFKKGVNACGRGISKLGWFILICGILGLAVVSNMPIMPNIPNLPAMLTPGYFSGFIIPSLLASTFGLLIMCGGECIKEATRETSSPEEIPAIETKNDNVDFKRTLFERKDDHKETYDLKQKGHNISNNGTFNEAFNGALSQNTKEALGSEEIKQTKDNKNDITQLMQATAAANVELVKSLLAANPKLDLTSRDQHGNTLLYYLFIDLLKQQKISIPQVNITQTVEYLLQAGVPCDFRIIYIATYLRLYYLLPIFLKYNKIDEGNLRWLFKHMNDFRIDNLLMVLTSKEFKEKFPYFYEPETGKINYERAIGQAPSRKFIHNNQHSNNKYKKDSKVKHGNWRGMHYNRSKNKPRKVVGVPKERKEGREDIIIKELSFYPRKIDLIGDELNKVTQLISELKKALIENRQINHEPYDVKSEESSRIQRIASNEAESKKVRELSIKIDELFDKLHFFDERLKNLGPITRGYLTENKLNRAEIKFKFLKRLWGGIESLIEAIKKEKSNLASKDEWQEYSRIDRKFQKKSSEPPAFSSSLGIKAGDPKEGENLEKENKQENKQENCDQRSGRQQEILREKNRRRDEHFAKQKSRKERLRELRAVKKKQEEEEEAWFGAFRPAPLAAPNNSSDRVTNSAANNIANSSPTLKPTAPNVPRTETSTETSTETKMENAMAHTPETKERPNSVYGQAPLGSKVKDSPKLSSIEVKESNENRMKHHPLNEQTFESRTLLGKRTEVLQNEVTAFDAVLQYDCPKTCNENQYRLYDSCGILLVCAQAMESLDCHQQCIFPKELANQFRNAIYTGQLFKKEDYIKRNAEIRQMAIALREYIAKRCQVLPSGRGTFHIIAKDEILKEIQVPIFNEILSFEVPKLHKDYSKANKKISKAVMDEALEEIENISAFKQFMVRTKWTAAFFLLQARLGKHFVHFGKHYKEKNNPEYLKYKISCKKYRKMAAQIRHNEQRPIAEASLLDSSEYPTSIESVRAFDNLSSDLISNISSAKDYGESLDIKTLLELRKSLESSQSFAKEFARMDDAIQALSLDANIADYELAFPPTDLSLPKSSMLPTVVFSIDSSSERANGISKPEVRDATGKTLIFTQRMDRQYEARNQTTQNNQNRNASHADNGGPP